MSTTDPRKSIRTQKHTDDFEFRLKRMQRQIDKLQATQRNLNNPATTPISTSTPTPSTGDDHEHPDHLTTIGEPKAEAIIFNTIPSVTPVEGMANWNAIDKVLEWQTDTDTRIQGGTETVVRVINKTGVQLDNGTVVYIDGFDIPANRNTVTKADASTWEDSQRTIGLMTSDVPDDGEGFCTIIGLVRDLDTSGLSPNSIVYLSETAGEFTTTKPTSPAFIIELGKTGKIDVADGTIFVHVSNNDDFGFFNGSFVETFDFLVSSDGATVTGSLQKTSGGNLTMRFVDGFSTLVTPPMTIVLTPGTATVPQENYLYILQSDKTQITKSLTGYPTTVDHIKIAKIVLLTAGITQTDDALANQNVNDHAVDIIGMGHSTHFGEWIREQSASYVSGLDGNSATGDDYLDIVTTTAYVVIQAGSIRQLHLQLYPAIDTSAGDILYVVNDPDAAYTRITDLVAGIDKLSTGANWSNNKYAGFVIFGIINKSGEGQQIMINLPAGEYTSQAGAENDINGYTNANIPDEFKSTGFLICKLVLQKKATTIEYKSTKDLRKPSFVISGVSGGGAITSFPDNTFDIHDEGDPTKRILFDASGITTATDVIIVGADNEVRLLTAAEKAALHARYTDVEAEAVADNKIAIHDAIVDAHHIKTVSGDIDHDATINFVGNEHLLPAAIDHDALLNYAANKHFLESSILLANLGTKILPNLTDVSLTGAQLEDLNIFGSGNADWIPLMFQGSPANDHSRGTRITGQSTGALVFVLPIPTSIGSLNLTITQLRYHIQAADINDYVDLTRVFGLTYSAQVEKYNDPDNQTSAGTKTDGSGTLGALTDFDASSYNVVVLYLNTSVNSSITLVGADFKCYYS